MTPRDQYAAVVDSIPSLTACQRLELKDAGDQYAARMIELHAHPRPVVDLGPYRLRAQAGSKGGAA